MLRTFAVVTVLLTAVLHLTPVGQDTFKPKILGPSKEGQKAMARMSLPKGTEATLYAAEPMLANPVSFCFDEQGNIYVAESFRIGAGVLDNRDHMKKKKTWLDDELACQTVADREAMFKKQFGMDFAGLGKATDRIRKLVDSQGTGVADKAFVFADGFNTPLTGVGAGVLARQGKVYYTCIPDLWMLEDTKGENKADKRQSLHYGFGVHTAYMGHDMHGLKMGPDGRVYFSIGDRGLNVKTPEGNVVANPHSGAVLRCWPDGSGLELFAKGLRNPQELVFDQYGNLFAGDNNADGGDSARWVHLVEGCDSGWRIGYQEMNKPGKLGPWNSEKVWNTQFAGQHANVVPPVGYIGNGPSGVTIHPGVAAIPERYKEHFFMCDFKGSSGQSGIHTFKLKPKGASFQFDAMPERFAWSVLATDCDFGPDGGFYISDWVDGWGLTGKGRIYKIADPKLTKDVAVLEVKKLLGEGMAKRSNAELLKLLQHADMRVRQEAQFALVDRKAQTELIAAATILPGVARLHGIWGLGMLKHYGTNAAIRDEDQWLVSLLNDKDMQVRRQTLKLMELGEFKSPKVIDAVIQQLKAKDPQVRMQAALTIGKFNKLDAAPAIAEMLRDNADKDAYLRHAGVMAFVRFGANNRDSLIHIGKDASPSVRLAALLAMRRLGMTEIAQFLSDADPRLVLEAARAINDEPIDQCLPELASLSTRKGMSDPLLYRVINANFRLKTKASAVALAKLAGRSDVSETMRVEALDCLLKWDQLKNRDRIVGLYRPVPAKPASDVADAVRDHISGIIVGPNKVRTEGAKVAAKFGVKEVGPALLEIAADVKRPADVRVESLKALATLNDKELEKAMKLALADGDPRVRTQGRHLLNKLKPGEIVEELKKALDNGDTIDRQGAFAILADLKQPEATALLLSWLDKLVAKKVPAEVQLDLLEAAEKNKAYALTGLLSQYEAQRSKTDALAKWSESMAGGDADNGKKIFFERSELSCVRCHKVQGNGGEVGPDLTGIGAKQKRDYLLESIVLPDKTIAQGFETVVLTLTDGKIKTGILKSEDKKELRLMTAEGQLIVVPVAEIDTRSRGPSAMPADLIRQLTRRELRDLVEYLAGLR